MVLLLNLIPHIVIFILGVWTYFRLKPKKTLEEKLKASVMPAIIAFIFAVLYQAALPGYIPKNEISRTSVPAFEEKELEVQNKLLSPVSPEQRDLIRQEQYRERLPFIEEEVQSEE